MQYKFVKEQLDYSDLASGRVFYSLPGHPVFPIRLASEIFQRCISYRKTIYGDASPGVLYDPCCGSAYHLSVLAWLHNEYIREVIASDVDENAVTLAKRNLELLTSVGIEKRIREISEMFEKYGKDSHRDALKSAYLLKEKIDKYDLTLRTFQANALISKDFLGNLKQESVDIVFTDAPYGKLSNWYDANDISNPLWTMLDALLGVLSRSSVVAIVSDKGQKVSHEGYQRLERFQVGKRRVIILKPV